MRGFKLEHKWAILRALELYAAERFLDFEDALAVAHMARRRIMEIVSYDTDFDRIAGITRVEP
jgi:predicted nucleic acid-binding protein